MKNQLLLKIFQNRFKKRSFYIKNKKIKHPKIEHLFTKELNSRPTRE